MSLMSMTGFGRAHGTIADGMTVGVVVRSVNHKYLDVVVRTNTRDDVPELEAAVRTSVVEALERGRVTVQVHLERTGPQPVRVVVNPEAVASLCNQLVGLRLPAGVTDRVGLGEILSIPGLVSVESVIAGPSDDEIRGVGTLASQAVADLVEMRRCEGEALGRRIADDVRQVEAFVDWIEPRADEFRGLILGRMRGRLAELVGSDTAVEPERVVQEAALIADRSDVTEEVVRLRSHLESFGERLTLDGAVGRALDFLCQEILRELNTLGSKCREVGVAERLVNAKAALERVREQVQNLE
ncbi:MAG: YicC/YloC family endoribonuclease [Holophagae bacterium]|jgi:uncharacterized protein (TIGR00255 family)